MEKQKKPKNRFLQRGGYALAITAIVIVAALVLNILATALAARFPLDLDLTAEKTFSMSEKNAKYLQEVSRPVTITVCSDEADYSATGRVAETMQNYYISDPTGKYLAQTLSILREYTKRNSNITLRFADPYRPSFVEIQQRFSGKQIGYGDILVESDFEVNGKAISRQQVIHLQDTYEMTNTSDEYDRYFGYNTFEISGSNLETLLTSAIFNATSEKSTQVSFIAAHSNQEDITALQAAMEQNNYEFSVIDNLLGQDIPAETDVLLITAPTGDFAGDELSKIDAFLENDGKRGKALLYFAGAASPELPNLYDFLNEWGIQFSDGILYETTANNYIGNPTTIGLQNERTDYTKNVNETSNVVYVASNCLPMETGFSTQGNRSTTQLLSSSDTVVVRPFGVGDEWKPSGKGGKAYAAGILSKDTIYAENMAELNSYVLAFSSVDFLNEMWSMYTYINNIAFALDAVNAAAGRSDDAITITTKTINNESYADRVNGLSSTIVKTVFIAGLPLLFVAVGIIVWARRKRR
ncbi:MAG: GldG family protein [Clostridiales bacterium]|nr:GldG family protein [Clostridiales bacterium]